MPKKNIEEDTNEEFKIEVENEIEEPVLENKVVEPVEKLEKKELALDSIMLTIRRVDAGGLYVIDNKGNGIILATPKEYKNKVLKAGDIIYVSKSEL